MHGDGEAQGRAPCAPGKRVQRGLDAVRIQPARRVQLGQDQGAQVLCSAQGVLDDDVVVVGVQLGVGRCGKKRADDHGHAQQAPDEQTVQRCHKPLARPPGVNHAVACPP